MTIKIIYVNMDSTILGYIVIEVEKGLKGPGALSTPSQPRSLIVCPILTLVYNMSVPEKTLQFIKWMQKELREKNIY